MFQWVNDLFQHDDQKHGAGYIKYAGAWGPAFDGMWENDVQNCVDIQRMQEEKRFFYLGKDGLEVNWFTVLKVFKITQAM